MAFTEIDKRKAMAIVRVFENGKPLGDYAAIAVLNDGAGVSYGVSQFTHRSGSLRAVVDEYLRLDGIVGRRVFIEKYRLLRNVSPEAIGRLSIDFAFKNALRAAAVTREMRAAQDKIAEQKYLKPAIAACEGSGFILPLSLAVIYDSMTHGSYEKIRDRIGDIASFSVGATSPERQSLSTQHGGKAAEDVEKKWITADVRARDAWLASIPRLRSTRYRTRFFLNQIMLGKWHLVLPFEVHGVQLTDDLIVQSTGFSLPLTDIQQPAFSTMTNLKHSANYLRKKQAEACALNNTLDTIETYIDNAAETYDQFERIATTVITRTDRAKSLWTTVTGTLFQTAWAVFSIAAGLPREVWFFAAGVGAALTLMYLYRQIMLGKIRERSEFQL